MKEYVSCTICGRNFVARIPKGGDGSFAFPRLHYAKKIPTTNNLGIMIASYKTQKVYCEGSFMSIVLKGD